MLSQALLDMELENTSICSICLSSLYAGTESKLVGNTVQKSRIERITDIEIRQYMKGVDNGKGVFFAG